ncbi:MAG: hypothetical protein CUN57_00755, partial [Phototrophicales bacterium]
MVYVVDFSGLEIIDVSDPTSPQQVGVFAEATSAADVYVSGNLAYVADRGNGLQIIDVSDPASPQEVASFNTRGAAQSVFVVNDLAYVADGPDGLYIIRNDLVTDVREESLEIPQTFALRQNYPNPFNPSTT